MTRSVDLNNSGVVMLDEIVLTLFLSSQKLEVREYVKNSGLGYTFIDTGFWCA